MQCVCFYHWGQKSKISPKADKCILIGYDNQSKASRCYNAQTRKVVISRKVVFDKRTFWRGHWRLPRRLAHVRWYWLLPQWPTRSEGNRRREQHVNTRRATNHSHCKQPNSSLWWVRYQHRRTRVLPTAILWRSTRIQNAPRRLLEFANITKITEPSTHQETKDCPQWQAAMQSDFDSIIRN